MISPEILRRYPFFAGLDGDILKQIAMFSNEHAYDVDDWLFEEGDDAEHLFIVREGAVKLTIAVGEAADRVEEVSTHGTGEVVGWSALVQPFVFTLGAQALVPTTVVTIDADKLRILLDENPKAGYRLLQNLTMVIGERLGNLRVQFISLVTP